MSMAIQNRYEFMYYLSCTNANPNGDPDMGNTPRVDPQTMRGYITDVATKRRIRNYVDMAYRDEPGMNIIIQQSTNINRHIARAKREAGFEDCAKGKEAVYAARAARLEERPMLRAQELGLYAWLLPMSENALVCEQCRRSMAHIREYDEQNHASMEQSARVYVQLHMEVAAAAKALYQHPNTVRYRLGKIQRLMDMEDDALFEPTLSLLVNLTRILESEERA